MNWMWPNHGMQVMGMPAPDAERYVL